MIDLAICIRIFTSRSLMDIVVVVLCVCCYVLVIHVRLLLISFVCYVAAGSSLCL